jgi:putative membrane protein
VRGRPSLLFLAVVAWPTSAWAHAPPPGQIWVLEPWLIICVFAPLLLYGIGAVRLARRSSEGGKRRVRGHLLFAAGWLSLAGATLSPLHGLSDRSFTLHMIEHEIFMLVSAPLLVLSRPLGPMLWAFPAAGRRALAATGRKPWLRTPWRALTTPVTATLLQAAALWLWHAPGLFGWALESEGWHTAQHLSFLVTALFFWQAMFDAQRRRGGAGQAAACLFVTSLVAGALGALMAFSQGPWYARYAALGMAPFGLTPVADQQLAGLLMWIPGGLVHAGAALWCVSAALQRLEGSEPRVRPAGSRAVTGGTDGSSATTDRRHSPGTAATGRGLPRPFKSGL